jgi:hypothetical protein
VVPSSCEYHDSHKDGSSSVDLVTCGLCVIMMHVSDLSGDEIVIVYCVM